MAKGKPCRKTGCASRGGRLPGQPDIFGELTLDFPDGGFAFSGAGFHRLAVKFLFQRGIAIVGVIALRSAGVILIEC